MLLYDIILQVHRLLPSSSCCLQMQCTQGIDKLYDIASGAHMWDDSMLLSDAAVAPALSEGARPRLRRVDHPALIRPICSD